MPGTPVSQGADGTWYDDQGNAVPPPPDSTPGPRQTPPVARHGGTTGSGGTDAPGTAGNVGQPTTQPPPTIPPAQAVTPFSGVNYPGFTPPPLPDALSKPFTLPTSQDLIANDPGYMARYQQGLDANQRSAAAQGTLLNGGTQKALAQYGQDFASGEYGQYVQQLLGQRQQQSADYLNLAYGPAWQQNQAATNQYGQLYGQYKDLIANNRNASNDYISQLLAQEQIGAQTAGAPPPSGTSNV